MWRSFIQSIEGVKSKNWGLPEKKKFYKKSYSNHKVQGVTEDSSPVVQGIWTRKHIAILSLRVTGFYKICSFHIHFNKIYHSFIKHVLVLNVMMFQGCNKALDITSIEDSPGWCRNQVELGGEQCPFLGLEISKSHQLGWGSSLVSTPGRTPALKAGAADGPPTDRFRETCNLMSSPTPTPAHYYCRLRHPAHIHWWEEHSE